MLSQIKNTNKQLDQIHKALDDYIEKKRESFLRFFFLSNQELFEILSHVNSAKSLIPYLRKVFENIQNLIIDKDEHTALEIESSNGERVQLKSCIFRSYDVEDMMNLLQDQMVSSIRRIMRDALISQDTMNRKAWTLAFPCQVVLAIDSIMYTRIAEQ